MSDEYNNKRLTISNGGVNTLVTLTTEGTNDTAMAQILGSVTIQVYCIDATGNALTHSLLLTHSYSLTLTDSLLLTHALLLGLLSDADGNNIRKFTWHNEMITISLTYSQKGTIMDSLGRVVYEGEWHEDLQHGVGVYRYTYSLTHSFLLIHSLTHLHQVH